MIFKKVTIIGVGLMGASLALALRKNSLCSEITGSGRKEENLRKARERGIIDAYYLSHADACKDADLIILATPVGSFKAILWEIRDAVKKGSIIMDIGSVKGSLVHELEEATQQGVFFIGAHPIAGSDQSGVDAARVDLFEDALCILTPTDQTDSRSLERMEGLWKAIGARLQKVSPHEHDRIFSLISHLPHVASYSLVKTVSDVNEHYINYSGQGFRDATRIALSSHELWADICRNNKTNLVEHLDILIRNLESISTMLKNDDVRSLTEYFSQARETRKSIE